MTTIQREQVLDIGSARFLVEASELGLKPGEWPEAIETNLGNGRPCRLVGVQPDGTRVYLQQFGVTRIAILND